MPAIDTSIFGTELLPISRSVTWRDTTNYAAAVGETNPRYFDDTRKGGLIAPPMFAVALTWQVFIDMPKGLGQAFTPQISATMVHATEHLEFHRPVKPGDKISMRSKVAAIYPTKAGTHLVMRQDAVDASGKPVFTEYNGAMLRGVKCDGDGRGKEDLPQTPELDNEPEWEQIVKTTRGLPYIYDGCSEIVFPIHTSPAFAKVAGLPDIILQGTATLALAARELVSHFADRDPARLKAIGCRFSAMVIPGTDIKVQVMKKQTAKDCVDYGFRVLNQEGKTALSQGFVRVGD